MELFAHSFHSEGTVGSCLQTFDYTRHNFMLQPTVLSLRILSYSHQVDVVISGLVAGYAKARTDICKKLQLLSEGKIEGPVAFPNWCRHGPLQSNAMFLQNTCSCRSGSLNNVLLICLKFSESELRLVVSHRDHTSLIGPSARFFCTQLAYSWQGTTDIGPYVWSMTLISFVCRV